jgi:hypothetical protein
MTIRNLTGGARWDEATGWPYQYAPPKPGNGIGGDPCPCQRPHGPLYSDGACDAAYARAELVRTTAIATSAERPWLEEPATVTAGRRPSTLAETFDRAMQAAAAAFSGHPATDVEDAAAWIRQRFDGSRAEFLSDPGGYLAYVDAPMDDATAAAAIDIIEAEWRTE